MSIVWERHNTIKQWRMNAWYMYYTSIIGWSVIKIQKLHINAATRRSILFNLSLFIVRYQDFFLRRAFVTTTQGCPAIFYEAGVAWVSWRWEHTILTSLGHQHHMHSYIIYVKP